MKERPADTDKTAASSGIDTRLVEKLGEIATRLNLSEIEIRNGDFEIRVARGFIGPQPAGIAPQPATVDAVAIPTPPKPEAPAR